MSNAITLKKQKSVNINGTDYFSLAQFAKLTDRSEMTLRTLIARGNKVRRLKVFHLFEKPFIPVSELFDFPFVTGGKPLQGRLMVERYVIDMQGELQVIEEEYKV